MHMSERTASNLLNKTKNWQKATSWLFTKRGGVEFRTTEDKTRSQGSERDLIPLHTHAKLFYYIFAHNTVITDLAPQVAEDNRGGPGKIKINKTC